MQSFKHAEPEYEAARGRGPLVARDDSSLMLQAASAGRADILGTRGLTSLQRLVGNATTADLIEESRSPVLDVIASNGSELDPGIRGDMEARLGADFGDVRVHTDDAAHESAEAVSAQAYTVGSDIAFQRDAYDPGSESGQRTLAHELTHVMQQRSGPVDGTAAGDGVSVSDPSDTFEREASANAERVMRPRESPVAAQREAWSANAHGVTGGVTHDPLGYVAVQRDSDDESDTEGGAPQQEPSTASSDAQSDTGLSADGSQASFQPNIQISSSEGSGTLPQSAAEAYLSNKIEVSANLIDLMAGENAALQKQRDDSVLMSVFGTIADVAGGLLTMPDPSIWEPSRELIDMAREAISTGDLVSAGSLLDRANKAFDEAQKVYLAYKDGNTDAAENVITGLKVVIVLDVAAGTVLTGGATLGALGAEGGAAATVASTSLTTQALATGTMAAETGIISDAGDQANSPKPWNWAESVEAGVGGFASGFLGTLMSGSLKEVFQQSWSSYVTEDMMSEEELKELAASLGVPSLERDMLESELQKFINEKVSEKAAELLIGKPIEYIVEGLKKSSEEGTPPMDEKTAVETVAQQGAPALLKAYLDYKTAKPVFRSAS